MMMQSWWLHILLLLLSSTAHWTTAQDFCRAFGCCANEDDSCTVDMDGGGVCYCDHFCALRGDCCPDFNDYCDEDECARVPPACHADATCTNTIGSYQCSCNPGFAGNGIQCIDENQGPCVTYTPINEPQRSTAFVPGASDDLICDNLLSPGWYRFVANTGGRMPETCVDQFHCGTQVPIWLNGAHPTDYNAVTLDGCMNYGVPDDCCTITVQIQVQKCTGPNADPDFFIYNLQPAIGCSLAYCAGTGQPCPGDQVWVEAHGCVDPVPQITQDPVLHPPEIDLNKARVTFTCEVKYAENYDDGARFDVKFLVNGNRYPEIDAETAAPLTGAQKTIQLDAKYLGEFLPNPFNINTGWRSKMGHMVSCVVQSFWESHPDVLSEEFHSNGYWAGIQAEETHLILPADRSQNVSLRLYSTMPFVCSDNQDRHSTCKISFGLKIDEGVGIANNDGDVCKISINAEDWDPTTHRAWSEERELLPAQNGQDTDGIFALEFKPIDATVFFNTALQPPSFVPHVFSGYSPEGIQVRVRGVATGTCSGTGGLHYTTFDEKYYHIYTVGEFVVSKSTIGTFEVQMRTFSCLSVFCQCGVAVREGNDAIIIDRCHVPWGSTASPRISQWTSGINPLSPGVTVHRNPNGLEFTITMPSGNSVKAQLNYWGMNVYLYAVESLKYNTVGLCGVWDDNPGNDFTKRDGTITNEGSIPTIFRDDWRIPRETSLFNLVALPDDPNPPLQFCTCADAETIRCGGQAVENDPTPRLDEATTVLPTLPPRTVRSSRSEPSVTRTATMSSTTVSQGIAAVATRTSAAPTDSDGTPINTLMGQYVSAGESTSTRPEENSRTADENTTTMNQRTRTGRRDEQQSAAPTGKRTVTVADATERPGATSVTAIIIGATCGGLILVLVTSIIICVLCRRRKPLQKTNEVTAGGDVALGNLQETDGSVYDVIADTTGSQDPPHQHATLSSSSRPLQLTGSVNIGRGFNDQQGVRRPGAAPPSTEDHTYQSLGPTAPENNHDYQSLTTRGHDYENLGFVPNRQ
ncbi:von Willebrand factor D and EGF domain-containing protein-like [Branchiostoma lanceolatum]|uniref:von Willebrand factor D and EGF domain-containing protein-like n=1 Tax=Branchiostoma lanceolatum TaxID=7740 RepID=UPI0034513998